MSQITRRTLLTAATSAATAAATATIALTPGMTAAATAGPRPHAATPGPRDTEVRQGNASITIFLNEAQDVAAIHYTITNVGSGPDTFRVWYTDFDNGRQSRKLTYSLGPGDSARAEVYGSVNHTFLVNVCQTDGTCFTVGPIGPVPSGGAAPARGLDVPARQAGASR
jgi:hypothetical protein